MVHIKRVEINGFVSFDGFELDLSNKENIIVGTNGCGKTNFMKIINYALTEHMVLKNYVNQDHNSNKFIKIYLDTSDQKFFLNSLYVLYLAHTLNNDFRINLTSIVTKLCDVDYFSKGIVVKCEYKNRNIIRSVVPSFCQCDKINFMTDYHNHKHLTCPVKKIFDEYQQICQTPLNPPNLGSQYTNQDDYFVGHIIKLLEDNEIFEYNDEGENIMNFINEYKPIIQPDLDNSIITMNDLTRLTLQRCVFQSIVENYIDQNVIYFSLKEYQYNHEIYKKLIEYEEKIHTSLDMTPSERINYFSKSLQSFIENINDDYSIREDLFLLKNECHSEFVNLQNIFTDIIPGKKFDIVSGDDDGIKDFEYVIITEGDEYHHCSNGEIELIDFLSVYYSNSCNIILIDEPCAHLSSQNKINFRNKFFNTTVEKQLIIITHDIELVGNDCNIIHFSLNNGKTIGNFLDLSESEMDKKNLYEHREVLFSDNLLLIEGYHDYKFMQSLFEVIGMNKYNLVILDGCGNKLWKLLDENLKINYKAVYDFDVLNNKKHNVHSMNTVNFIMRQSKNDKFKKLKDVEITINDIINKKDMIKNKRLIHVRILFMIINEYILLEKESEFDISLLFNNNIQILHGSDNKYRKIIEQYFCKMEQEKNKYKSIHAIKFTLLFEEIYDKIRNEYDYTKEPDFDSKYELSDIYEPIIKEKLLSGGKIVDYDTPDDIIEEEIKCGKYFIWNSTIKDLEGIGKKIFNNNFIKENWYKKSKKEIRRAITENKNIDEIKLLISFLEEKEINNDINTNVKTETTSIILLDNKMTNANTTKYNISSISDISDNNSIDSIHIDDIDEVNKPQETKLFDADCIDNNNILKTLTVNIPSDVVHESTAFNKLEKTKKREKKCKNNKKTN